MESFENSVVLYFLPFHGIFVFCYVCYFVMSFILAFIARHTEDGRFRRVIIGSFIDLKNLRFVLIFSTDFRLETLDISRKSNKSFSSFSNHVFYVRYGSFTLQEELSTADILWMSRDQLNHLTPLCTSGVTKTFFKTKETRNQDHVLEDYVIASRYSTSNTIHLRSYYSILDLLEADFKTISLFS